MTDVLTGEIVPSDDGTADDDEFFCIICGIELPLDEMAEDDDVCADCQGVGR